MKIYELMYTLEKFLVHAKHNVNVNIYYHYNGKKLFNHTYLVSYAYWVIPGKLPNLIVLIFKIE